jgi:hypothetical protein
MKVLWHVFIIAAILCTFGCSDNNQKVINDTVTQLKNQLPKQVDSVTEWSDVKSGPNRLIYLYTVRNLGDDALEAIKSSIRPNLVQALKLKRKEMDNIWSRDIELEFQYYDEEGTLIVKELISRADLE